jgi:hypothetical protein
MKKIPAAELDRRFDAGEDMSAYVDMRAVKPLRRPTKVDAAALATPSSDGTTSKKPKRKVA